MATINALITSPTPLVASSIASGSSPGGVTTSTYTNNTGKYLIIVAEALRPGATGGFSLNTRIVFNMNNGGGATAYTRGFSLAFEAGPPYLASLSFVLAPNQGFNVSCTFPSGYDRDVATALTCNFIGYSLSPEF